MVHKVSFKHAWDGLVFAYKEHPNMKIHGLMTLLVLILGWNFTITRTEWLVLLMTIMLVTVVEMMNTAIESMTDLITTEHRKKAKIAKDVSAGMVLATAIASVVVGIVIFGPYLI